MSDVLIVVAVLVALVWASVFCGLVYPCCCALVLDFLSSLSWFGGLLVSSSCIFGGCCAMVWWFSLLGWFAGSFVILGFCVLVLGLLPWCSVVVPCLVEASLC